ncbi:putative calcium-transporting ATPase 13, plasma membrane-type [Eucalyptus grandis]|uniref:putative calcium-transporting ATPase 13, plasma membrane-type n=1 Tax=Eucalyptus grandis TaxID=71139 RepID=UPI00192F0040|nr:putative calcium-transporting ATPase 13, plasma membrane-type [Eucalyptus grandis]
MTSILRGDDVRYEVSLDLPTAMSKFAKPWHLAFVTIYCSRAFTTSAKKTKKLSPRKSPSYASISILDLVQSTGSDQPSSFNIDQSQLTKLVKDKDLCHLQEFGGVQKVGSALETDVSAGISGDPHDVSRRQNAFGVNAYKKPPAKSFFHFVVEAFKDLTIMILLVCAGLSLGFGIKENGVNEGWYDGGSIFVAVFLVIAVSAGSNYRQNQQFEKLSRVSGNILIDVIRKGRPQRVSIFEIVVGDVVCLKIGDQVPADGLFLDGQSLQVWTKICTGLKH